MKYLSFLDKITYTNLIIGAVLMGLAPFVPMPHSIEKILLLVKGELTKPIDIFDLLFHLSPLFIIGLKFYYSKNKVEVK
ncbi:MAG: hypothetical protein KBF99_04475 [Leptospiraceae bacterium]|jgi:hypothetical protein|nr:hypothetical protein [Leptospiraceae bacterium]MBK7058310.1 hypothetical protein [Leptospiraceae bacterium]MBL0265605.1 hypothetical protein [Leptospiraceae bacterium]MBP9162411.1 hypothetical protein [Leptospiraceae bacterium]